MAVTDIEMDQGCSAISYTNETFEGLESKCQICDKELSTPGSLQKHMAFAYWAYQYDVCMKTFVYRDSLD